MLGPHVAEAGTPVAALQVVDVAMEDGRVRVTLQDERKVVGAVGGMWRGGECKVGGGGMQGDGQASSCWRRHQPAQ